MTLKSAVVLLSNWSWPSQNQEKRDKELPLSGRRWAPWVRPSVSVWVIKGSGCLSSPLARVYHLCSYQGLLFITFSSAPVCWAMLVTFNSVKAAVPQCDSKGHSRSVSRALTWPWSTPSWWLTPWRWSAWRRWPPARSSTRPSSRPQTCPTTSRTPSCTGSTRWVLPWVAVVLEPWTLRLPALCWSLCSRRAVCWHRDPQCAGVRRSWRLALMWEQGCCLHERPESAPHPFWGSGARLARPSLLALWTSQPPEPEKYISIAHRPPASGVLVVTAWSD